jgi:hypothetical protein
MGTFGDERAVLQHALTQAVASARANSIAKHMESPDAPDPDTAEATRAWVALAQAMLVAGKITASESLLFSTFAVEAVHTKRWLEHAYPELELLSRLINEIDRAEGLTPDQYWAKGDGPEEHRRLSESYSAARDERFAETLIEFGLTDLAALWRDDRAEYDRRREIGRRAAFEEANHRTSVSASIAVYEQEALTSAGAGAFYAASVMLGAAAEARLLEALLSRPDEAQTALSRLPRAQKPKNADPLHWSLEHMITVADAAGWLGVIEDGEVGANVSSWLLAVRNLRNLLHPGRHARDKPHAIIGSEEYVDAKFGYAALCIVLNRASPDTSGQALECQ